MAFETSGVSLISNLVLVTGSRTWADGRAIYERLAQEPADTTIIEGGAKGADELCRYAAKLLGFRVITVKADWSIGRSGGPLRNVQMLNMQPVKVIAFCRNKSRGTMDCVRGALSRNIPVDLIDSVEGEANGL